MFSGYFLAFALVFPSFSLPMFSPFLITCCHVSCSAWPVLRGGLAALCLVSRRFVWYRGALLRGLSRRRCECELVNPCESLASRVPVVPLPLRSKHRGTTVFSVSIDLAPRGEDGVITSAEEAVSSASSASSDRSSAVLPITSPPRGLLARIS